MVVVKAIIVVVKAIKVVVNAKNAALTYKRALHLFPALENGWIPQVNTCSALDKKGLNTIWKLIVKHNEQMQANSYFSDNRNKQNTYWLHHIIKEELGNKKYQQLKVNNTLSELEQALENGSSIYEVFEKL